ncbi:class A beta-lactamase [Arenimonas sp.]|uniref:class A beta-lactamase n=1 Tax=Arenimonas sp. TaxID=1872635 RepID=UPI0039E41B6E
MSVDPARRRLLLTAACLPAIALAGTKPGTPPEADFAGELGRMEKEYGMRIGVAALDLRDGRRLGHREGERFPMCSTFKLLLAAAVLARSVEDAQLMPRRIAIAKQDIVTYSPVTEARLADGMTVAELCQATLQRSDNAAANLLMKQIGGPEAVTAYARLLGDAMTRLDRWETELNSAIPGDERDTTTPQAMLGNLRALFFGGVLPQAQRQQLEEWIRGNKTGDERIRAGVPATWAVGDKTGSGAYGSVNDIGVIWPPTSEPILLVIYTTHDRADAKGRNEAVARATSLVVRALR